MAQKAALMPAMAIPEAAMTKVVTAGTWSAGSARAA